MQLEAAKVETELAKEHSRLTYNTWANHWTGSESWMSDNDIVSRKFHPASVPIISYITAFWLFFPAELLALLKAYNPMP